MSTEILWNVPSLIIWSPGTIKILTFNVGHAQQTNQSMTTTSSIKSTMCSVMSLHIFVDQLVLHSKIFSGSPMPYSQKDIHSSKLLQIYLYSIRPCEFCVSMLSQHVSLGLVCKMPWHKSLLLQANNLTSFWNQSISITDTHRFLTVSKSNTAVQTETLTSYKSIKDSRGLFTFAQTLNTLNLG